MLDRFIIPNFHVILIHYPLGLLTLGVLIELLSFIWRRNSIRTAGRWMIGLGTFMAFPAALSGIYALADMARSHNPMPREIWHTMRLASPLLGQPEVWRLMKLHVVLQGVSAGLCAFAVFIWISSSDRGRAAWYWAVLGLLVIGVGLIGTGAWYAGEAIYRHDAISTVPPRQIESVDARSATEPATIPADAPVPIHHPSPIWEKYFPPMEMHIVSAGLVAALALLAMALAWRKVNATYEIENMRPLASGGEPFIGGVPRTPPDPVAMVRTFNPDIEVTVQPFAPAGRFWLITCLAALLTMAAGVYMVADIGKPQSMLARAQRHHRPITELFWEDIKPEPGKSINRDTAHFVAASLLVVLPLVSAGLSRWSPRRKVPLAIFSLAVLVLIAAQIWLGILILYDSHEGPLTRFNL